MASAHKKDVHIQVEHECHRELKRRAHEMGVSMTFIIEALADAFTDGDIYLKNIVMDSKIIKQKEKIVAERGYISRDVLYDLIEAGD